MLSYTTLSVFTAPNVTLNSADTNLEAIDSVVIIPPEVVRRREPLICTVSTPCITTTLPIPILQRRWYQRETNLEFPKGGHTKSGIFVVYFGGDWDSCLLRSSNRKKINDLAFLLHFHLRGRISNWNNPVHLRLLLRHCKFMFSTATQLFQRDGQSMYCVANKAFHDQRLHCKSMASTEL